MDDECSFLLPAVNSYGREFDSLKTFRRKCNHFCISSKSVCTILLWNFAALLLYKIYDTTSFLQFNLTAFTILDLSFGIIAIFAPLAGLLTDVKFSRYKAVMCSSYSLLIEVLLVVLLAFPVMFISYAIYGYRVPFIAAAYICAVVILITVVHFVISGFQFGMDQLHDSPTENFILFIHWYVWLCYVSTFIVQIASNLLFYDAYEVGYFDSIRTSGCTIAVMLFFFIVFALIILPCVVRVNKVWFHIEPARVNPYKLVYRVVKFACQHKVPLRRSAFTYCEDEFPSRLDLGKRKYGGPFTTKQVEDVKAFGGILKVLICIGPAFMLQTVIQSTLLAFSQHDKYFLLNQTTERQIHLEGVPRHILISNGLLSPLLVTICIPLYLCLIRPHIFFRIPGMLKRIGLGIALMIVSLVAAFAMDVVVHARDGDVGCMFHGLSSSDNETEFITKLTEPPFYQNLYFFSAQHILSALVNVLVDIAVFEFICSQSPYSLKGLLLGSFYSIKSLFQVITLLSTIPFGLFWQVESLKLSCGSGFYILYIVVGIVELVLFTFVAKRYKYRTVNEPSNEYRYAEEYYSNIQ